MLKAFSVVGCFITYIAWVHMYTPGGSAIELPLFVVHACQNRDSRHRWIYLYLGCSWNTLEVLFLGIHYLYGFGNM